MIDALGRVYTNQNGYYLYSKIRFKSLVSFIAGANELAMVSLMKHLKHVAVNGIGESTMGVML